MNIIDLQFYRLAEEISALSRGALYEKMRTSFDGLSPDIRNRLSVYFGKFGFWGKLDPANGVFEEIELKADELHNHIDDFVWLYGRLSDYRSKKTLYAVLNNWYAYDFKTTTQVKEYAFDEYFDHDIISRHRGRRTARARGGATAHRKRTSQAALFGVPPQRGPVENTAHHRRNERRLQVFPALQRHGDIPHGDNFVFRLTSRRGAPSYSIADSITHAPKCTLSTVFRGFSIHKYSVCKP